MTATAASTASSAEFCICRALFGKSTQQLATPLAAATVAQFIFGAIWFSLIVRNVYCRSLSVDKGVKAVAFIRQLYPVTWAFFTSLATGLFRAAAIVSIVYHATQYQASAGDSLCIFAQAGAAVWILCGIVAFEEALYAQRPLSLIIVSNAHNLGCCMVAAVVLFFASKQ